MGAATGRYSRRQPRGAALQKERGQDPPQRRAATPTKTGQTPTREPQTTRGEQTRLRGAGPHANHAGRRRRRELHPPDDCTPRGRTHALCSHTGEHPGNCENFSETHFHVRRFRHGVAAPRIYSEFELLSSGPGGSGAHFRYGPDDQIGRLTLCLCLLSKCGFCHALWKAAGCGASSASRARETCCFTTAEGTSTPSRNQKMLPQYCRTHRKAPVSPPRREVGVRE